MGGLVCGMKSISDGVFGAVIGNTRGSPHCNEKRMFWKNRDTWIGGRRENFN